MIKKYHKFLILLLSSVIIFSFSACETTPVRNTPLPGEPVADPPKIMVGDTWMYTVGKDTLTSKVTEVRSDGSFTIENNYKKGKKTLISNFDKRFLSVDPPQRKNINFPCFVGKKWSDKYHANSVSGVPYDYENDYIVVKYETVTTKAGSFKAFKILQRQYNTNTNWIGTGEYWYSPEVKRVVKENFSWRIGQELISFNLAPEIKNYTLSISSTPSGANIYLDNIHQGKTPKKIEIKDGTDLRRYDIRLEKEGYKILKDSVGLSEDGCCAYNLEIKENIHVPEIDIFPPVDNSKTGKCYAVIIGISKYKDDRIPKLKFTTADALEMYSIVTDPLYGNFPRDQVKLLIDEEATDNKIKSAIGTWLKRNAGKDGTVIIFFAGHGAPEDEKTYWVTYNANIDDLYGTALSNDEISDMLDRIEAKKMIVFLDSCYSAATIHRTEKERSITFVKDPFQKFKGKGRVIITSSDGKEESVEIEKFGHGVFTYYLIKALKGEADENKNGLVELDEVWGYVKYRVSNTARKHGGCQTPIIDGSYSAGIVLSKHPERIKEIELEAEREKKLKELETKIIKLKELYLKNEIKSNQFDKAVKILKSGEYNKLLDDFLSDKISLTTFKTVFK